MLTSQEEVKWLRGKLRQNTHFQHHGEVKYKPLMLE